ncbi:MAG TPA: hypothetical protein EYG89_02005 [Bacteroidia bacterium]|nr:hypothetical protein [Bacteroidia bacterium]
MKKINHIEFKNIKAGFEGVSENSTRLNGIKINFYALNDDKIHFTSSGDIVRIFPNDLNISLDFNALTTFTGMLIETISSYLFQIRDSIMTKDLVQEISSSIDSRYKIRVRISRMFFREEEKGRYKASIAFLDKNTDEEVVNISFSKRDIQVMLGMIRGIVSEYDRDYGSYVPGLTLGGNSNQMDNLKIIKVENSIMIGNIWLHGQEITNLQYTVNELLNRLYIEKNLKDLRGSYRQIKFVEEEMVMYMFLEKYTENSESENTISYKIPLTQKILSILYLYVNIDILGKIPASEFEDETTRLERMKMMSGEKVRYHLSMKESNLAIGIRDRNKSDEKKMLLLGEVKLNAFQFKNEDDEVIENFIHKYVDGEKIYVDLLTEFKIDLKDHWKKLVRGLSLAYTKEYTSERDRNKVLFYVINQDNKGRWKYQFTIVSDKENKATAVLIIEKFKIHGRENEELVGRFRQPLFNKYVYQLISMILVTAKDMDNIEFYKDLNLKDLSPYSYSSMKTVSEVKKDSTESFGIKRTKDKVLFGSIFNEKLVEELDDIDRALLRVSAEFKLLNGYWLPFSSNKVTISQDGYLKDMFSEVNLNENFGVDWATMLYFGAIL